MIAAKAGDKEELERTVDEGVDVDYQNEVMSPFLVRKAVLLEKERDGFPHQRAGGLRRGRGVHIICFFLPIYTLYLVLLHLSFIFHLFSSVPQFPSFSFSLTSVSLLFVYLHILYFYHYS